MARNRSQGQQNNQGQQQGRRQGNQGQQFRGNQGGQGRQQFQGGQSNWGGQGGQFSGQGNNGGGRRQRRVEDLSYGASGRTGGGIPTGKFTGLGPKNYHRTDDRIKDEVIDLLTRHGMIDARELTVDVKDGMVTLGGQLYSRRIKFLAEEVIGKVFGVKDVVNQIRVVERPELSGDLSTMGGQQSTQRTQAHAPS